MLTGAVITETIFAWPGVGRLLIQSISFRDYPMVQGCILLIAVTYVAMNLLTDLVYGVPRSADPLRVTPRVQSSASVIVLVVVLVAAALLAPWLSPYDPAAQELPLRLDGPTCASCSVSTSSAATSWRACSPARASRCWSGSSSSASRRRRHLLGAVAGYFGGVVDDVDQPRRSTCCWRFPGCCWRLRSWRCSVRAWSTSCSR